MDKLVKLKFTYTPEDTLRVARFLSNRSFIYRNDAWLTGGIVFIVFIFVILLMANDISEVRIVATVIFSAIPATVVAIAVFALHKFLQPWTMRRTIAKNFASSPTASEEASIVISELGIETKTPLSSSFIKWPAITQVSESDSDVLFYNGSSLNFFLPKEHFCSAEELQIFNTLLFEMLGEKASLKNDKSG